MSLNHQIAHALSDLVFVYGSLREGLGNHHVLEGNNAKKIADTSVEIPFTMKDIGAFPGLVPNADGDVNAIYGEIYSVSKEGMRALDSLEGFPRFYSRILIPTEMGTAWVYYLCAGGSYSQYKTVHSGNWLERLVEDKKLESGGEE